METPGLRSVEEVRQGIRQGHAARLYERLLTKADGELIQPAWTPRTPLPGRDANAVRHANREFTLVGLVARRIEDASLAGLLTGQRQYADSVLSQIRSILDAGQWPEIEDLTHLQCGDVCSLRRGQLAFAIGQAYDWLYALLTAAEREEIVRGFNTRFVRAFQAALAAKHCRWRNWKNNFIPCIFGGFETAARALGADYEGSEWLLETTQPRMREFLSELIGPEGEFNESVPYAGSVADTVHYLAAQRYAGTAGADVFCRYRVPEFCRWYVHMVLPPGRVAGFGDPAPDMPPVVDYFAAVAAAELDPVLQWFYLNYVDTMQPTHRRSALELLSYDAALSPQPPDGRLPLGKAYHAQGKLTSSRSSWNPKSADSVVYSKAGREDCHGHPDWGQVCIDGFGQRLIVDLGSTPGYPGSGKEFYYNYQQRGHNVLVIGHNDTGGVSLNAPAPQGGGSKYPQGHIASSQFDDAVGGVWVMELTAVYAGSRAVRRSVLHLLPGIVAVLDEALLNEPQDLSLRWHTAGLAELAADGRFSLRNGPAALAARMVRLDGPPGEVSTGRHEYRAPYNVNRLGDPYPQRGEPFIEVRVRAATCRLLTLFAVFGPDRPPSQWEAQETGWAIDTTRGRAIVSVRPDIIEAAYAGGPGLRLPRSVAPTSGPRA